jgi:tRNA (adenine57-N1/adenine58-N1)-methyltransferase
VIAEGDLIHLCDRAGRRYPVVVKAQGGTSLHSGTVQHEDLIGRPEGTIVQTNTGTRLLAVKPTFAELIVGRRRRAQPIYPKDLGAILIGADIRPGLLVLEAGTGTGALTIALIRAVGPAGRVISVELRGDFLEAARGAVQEILGEVPPNLDLRLGDVTEGIPEQDLDRVLLDLPEPWLAVPASAAGLRPGGILFAHCPNVSQVQRFVEALRDRGGFGLMETVELLQRGWTVRGRSLRPAHRMVAHTGFLTFARRLATDVTFETEGEGF